MSWIRERWDAAVDSVTTDAFKWLIRGAVALVLFGAAWAVGIRTDLLPPPPFWPSDKADLTARIEVGRTTMNDAPGYGFINEAFAEAEKALDGNGSLQFADERLRDLRVCLDVVIPPQPDAGSLLTALRSKVSPCLTIRNTPEVGGRRYTVAAAETPELRMVMRTDENGSQPVRQYFCHCSDAVIEAFLSSSRWR